MASTVILKNSSVPAKVPGTGDLVAGELAINTADSKLYMKNSSNAIVEIGGGSSGIANLVEDLTPQLGGDLDCNTHNIIGIAPTLATHLTRKDYVDAKMVQPAAVSLTSGTYKDWVIPSGTKEITFQIYGLNMVGNDELMLRLGSSSTPKTTGYTGSLKRITTNVNAVNYQTFGMLLTDTAGSMDVWHGEATLRLIDPATFKWSVTSKIWIDGSIEVYDSIGFVTLAAECDLLRVTTVFGTDTFSTGTMNIITRR